MSEKIIINVGRQYGSGGRRVAEALGKKLGIPVYNNELIVEAAKKSGYSAEIFAKKDEKKHFFNLFSDNYNNDDEVFKIQSEVIREIAEKGSAIFVGRASDYVLRDMDCCVNVFISCPLSIRKQFIARRRGVSVDEAESICQKEDRGRETYYNYFTFSNWGVASNYHLCLDSSLIGVEGCADFIIDFARKCGKLK